MIQLYGILIFLRIFQQDSEEGYVPVQRRFEPSTTLFSISTFEESKTDYKGIGKAVFNN
jgi:hypothetical protein